MSSRLFHSSSRASTEAFFESDEFRAKKPDTVVVLGGDGTVNSVISKMKGSAMDLLVYPLGTANDLATHLGITKQHKNQFGKLISEASANRIDVIQCTTAQSANDFVTVGGFGVGAVVGSLYNKLREKSSVFSFLGRVFKSQIYKLLSVAVILGSRKIVTSVEIQSDGFYGKIDICSAFVCNQGKLGGDLKVAPLAVNNDGLFDVLVIPAMSRLELLKTLVDLSRGKLSPSLLKFRASRMKVTVLEDLAIEHFGDGEPFVPSKELNYQITSEKLSLICN